MRRVSNPTGIKAEEASAVKKERRREGGAGGISDGKKSRQCEIFPAIDLFARDMHRFLYVEDKCL